MLTKEQSGSCGKQKFIKRKEKITALGCLMAFFLVGRNPAGGHPQVTCPAPDIVTAVPVVCHPCLWFDVDDARQEESSLNTASQAQGRGGRQGGKKNHRLVRSSSKVTVLHTACLLPGQTSWPATSKIFVHPPDSSPTAAARSASVVGRSLLAALVKILQFSVRRRHAVRKSR
ncbi:hypothetical protein CCHR01_12547 [Colletotrichum chrysophilum]|uniref:Uncharacterized protein n=1 Tax=Colletotrichum chrysophilum TaxID=1836956 RepID=A0AAD9AB35_9PEZI|nr:hypothetical protein CCHR01_12547 [Colletotrichum chrysophilum]